MPPKPPEMNDFTDDAVVDLADVALGSSVELWHCRERQWKSQIHDTSTHHGGSLNEARYEQVGSINAFDSSARDSLLRLTPHFPYSKMVTRGLRTS